MHYPIQQYAALFAEKCERIESRFAALKPPPAECFASPATAFRMRAEFRVWHEGDELFYAMFNPADPRTPLPVQTFPIASQQIQSAMPRLLAALRPAPDLRRKLFQVEFLSTLSGELLITLIYHRPLDEVWESAARALGRGLDADIVGRSRKQKLVLSRDYVEELLPLAQGPYRYRQYEQAFTQPNARVNCQMIDWACRQAQALSGDLLELYCGNGNFTLPLAAQFERVLATEVSKQSILAAQHNRELNGVDNLCFARLSAEEMGQALAGEREFRRLAGLEPPLAEHRFSTLFVDPPRAGLDAATCSLAAGFEHILYISCNPDTLLENLSLLDRTHRVEALALFDQFPYTDHMECGVRLRRR